MNPATEDRIIDLWATTFLHYKPEGHEAQQAALTALAEQGTDLLQAADSAAIWLQSAIQESASAYLERWAEAPVQRFDVEASTVIHGYGDYQPLTNHPNAYLSGIYYVTVPDGLREDHHRFDVDSNAISFYDPRFAMNMGAIAKDPNADMEKLVHPEAGVLMLWPSFVDFFIHPNLSADKQISVHFNINVERSS